MLNACWSGGILSAGRISPPCACVCSHLLKIPLPRCYRATAAAAAAAALLLLTRTSRSQKDRLRVLVGYPCGTTAYRYHLPGTFVVTVRMKWYDMRVSNFDTMPKKNETPFAIVVPDRVLRSIMVYDTRPTAKKKEEKKRRPALVQKNKRCCPPFTNALKLTTAITLTNILLS